MSWAKERDNRKDDVILDGGNSLRGASAARGIEPRHADYDWLVHKEDEWIISQNIHHRSLTVSPTEATV